MEYTIAVQVVGLDPEWDGKSLIKQVNELIQQGWMPSGGICAVERPPMLFQPMIRKQKRKMAERV